MTHSLDPETSHAPDHASDQGVSSSAPAAPLADTALAEEIELYTDVVVAATESDGPISEGDLDRVLGVEGGPTGA